MESLERSAARRRTLSNSSTTSTPSSGSSRTPSSAPLTGNRNSSDKGRKSAPIKESAEERRSSSMRKRDEEDGIDDCDETTPFTASSMTEQIQQQDQSHASPSSSIPLLSGQEESHQPYLSHAQTSDLMNNQAAASSASNITLTVLSGKLTDQRACASNSSESESNATQTLHALCPSDGKCFDNTNMTSSVENSDETRTPIYKIAATSSIPPFPPPPYSAVTLGDGEKEDSLSRDNANQSQRQTLHKQQLVTLINTPAPELLHVHLHTEIESDPQPAITVIAIDPESGSSLYSPKPTSFVYPGFTPVDVSATNAATDSPAPHGVKAPSSQSGVRTVCGACGGVMPPPGTAIHLAGVGASVVGIGGSVGLTQAKAILLTDRAHHQNIPVSGDDFKSAVGVVCESVDVVNVESPATDATIHASSTSTSLQTSTGTPSNVDICRICHCEGEEPDAPLIAPCYCTGSLRWVHQSCLQQWIKSSETRKCELCKFEFIMETKIKPFQKWEKLQMTTVERRKIMCSVTFHAIAITCVIWSLYVLIDRTTDEIRKGNLEWPFWTKLIVVAIGFIGGLVFMYVQFKMYIALCRRWRAFNRVIYVQDIPDALLTSSKEKLKASGLLTSSKAGRTGRGSSASGSASASKEDTPELIAASRADPLEQQRHPPSPHASPSQQPCDSRV